MQGKYDIIGHVRGLGAMVGEIMRYCFEHGLIVYAISFLHS